MLDSRRAVVNSVSDKIVGGSSVMPGLSRDRVALFFEQVGTGSPPLPFVHGWVRDHEFFAPRVEHFSQTHRTIAAP